MLQGNRRRIGAAGGAEFGNDVADVEFDRREA